MSTLPGQSPLPDTAAPLLQTTALVRDVSAEFTLHLPPIGLRAGEILAVVGPNGSGKSSTLRLLAGLHVPDVGSVDFREQAHVAHLAPIQHRKRAHAVGFVPHAPSRWPFALREQLTLDAGLLGTPSAHVRPQVDFWLSRLGLDAEATKSWSSMSAGFRMRSAIARQLISGPHVLVLDEPIGPLDIATQRLVLQQLRDIASDPTLRVCLVISSQHLHEIESIADTLLILRNGESVWFGPRAEFGGAFSTTLFEVAAAHPDQLRDAIVGQPWRIVHADDLGVRIECPADTPSRTVLTHLLDRGVDITHFRDLSRSAARVALDDAVARPPAP
jgi:ABC-2 type transport system ATP-binding protein